MAEAGLLAEFGYADALVAAARAMHQRGYRRIDAFSPFPIDELAEVLGFSDGRVPVLVLIGGIVGLLIGFGVQIYANVAYPLNIGGRPLLAWQAFMLIGYELMVLFAVAFALFGMLALNHLPRLHHPLYDVETFSLATTDRFFLFIARDDRLFDLVATRDVLARLAPVRIDYVRGAAPEEADE